MDSVNFKVCKGDVTKNISITIDNSIESLKDLIKEIFNISKYIDIDFQIEKPMRILGKFNVEPGILPRTFDRYNLDKFGIKGEIQLTFHEISDYTSPSISKSKVNLTKITNNKVDFNINSEEDFPKLS